MDFENIFASILTFLFLAFVSWGVVVSVIKLITFCFEWNFDLMVATGIWLVLGTIIGVYKKLK